MQKLSGDQITWNEYIDLTLCTTAKRLAERMRSDEATLLPLVHREFFNEVHNGALLFPHLTPINDSDIPSTRWLLSWLHSLLGNSLQVQCSHKRYGSVLFHKDCDLVKPFHMKFM